MYENYDYFCKIYCCFVPLWPIFPWRSLILSLKHQVSYILIAFAILCVSGFKIIPHIYIWESAFLEYSFEGGGGGGWKKSTLLLLLTIMDDPLAEMKIRAKYVLIPKGNVKIGFF